jgi:hypothetical protein
MKKQRLLCKRTPLQKINKMKNIHVIIIKTKTYKIYTTHGKRNIKMLLKMISKEIICKFNRTRNTPIMKNNMAGNTTLFIMKNKIQIQTKFTNIAMEDHSLNFLHLIPKLTNLTSFPHSKANFL